MSSYIVLASALFAGKAAQIAALALVTIALGAFGVVAMRLRKGVVNTLDEATESVINKFVIPKDGSSTSVSSISGSGSGTQTFNNINRNIQTAMNTGTSAAIMGNQVGNLLNGGDVESGNKSGGNMLGKVFGTGSGDSHETVASGTGDTTVNQANAGAEVNSSKMSSNSALAQNANENNTNSDSYDNGVKNSAKSIDSATGNVSNVDADARTTSNGVATGGEYQTAGYMDNQKRRDVVERNDGKDALQYDSLAAMSTKEVQANGAAAHSVVGTGSANGVKSVRADATGHVGADGVAGVNGTAGVGSDVNVSTSTSADANVKGVAAVNGADGRAGYGEAGAAGAAGKGGVGAVGASGAAGKAGQGADVTGVNASSSNTQVRGVQVANDGRPGANGQAAVGSSGVNGAAGRGAMNMNTHSSDVQQRNVRVSAGAGLGSQGGAGSHNVAGVNGQNGVGTVGQSGQFGQAGMVRDRSARASGGQVPQGMYAGMSGSGTAGKAGAAGAGGAGGSAGQNGVNGVSGGMGMYRQTRVTGGSGAGTSYVPGGNRYGNAGRPTSRNPRAGAGTRGVPSSEHKRYDPSVENASRGVGPVGSQTGSSGGGAAGHYQPRQTPQNNGTYRNSV